jgi:predicted DNA-binding WGR domain protein
MAEEKTYLELSEDAGVSHKFYEVIVDGTQLRIRYGRIGTDGTLQTSSFPTVEKARAEAQKKIKSKTSKGYAPAVMGERKRRSVTRRVIQSAPSTARSSAPLLWKFSTGRSAFGVFIDDRHCWVGNENGEVYCLNHSAEVVRQFKLPDGVKCIVSDGEWLYAGCDDGNVYDLTGKVPRVAYRIAESVDIYWLDIHDGVLGVSDAQGGVTIINHEDEGQWERKSSGPGGWMVRCDEIGVYHGHSGGVTMYDWEDGTQLWHQGARGSVLFGWQEEGMVYAGTGYGTIECITKRGELARSLKCDGGIFSCAAAPGGKYVFGGDSSSTIYCFNEAGERLWKLGTGCGSAFSMQYHNERLYLVTTDGSLACVDVGEAAIAEAQAGRLPERRDLKADAAAAAAVSVSSDLEVVTDAGAGVIVECVKVDGKLRVRPVSAGYDRARFVQFPKNIREEGARYVVDGLRDADRGGFYRASGEIRRLR